MSMLLMHVRLAMAPQMNPDCKDKDCGYCEKEINFPRHYPKLWLEEKDFNVKKIEGKTRCWCDTGCPVYYMKSWLYCRSECTETCAREAVAAGTAPKVDGVVV